MAGAEGDRIRLEGEATSVIGAVVDFYERHLRDRYEDHVEELREMKRGVMGQHNTYVRAWSLWTLTKCQEDLIDRQRGAHSEHYNRFMERKRSGAVHVSQHRPSFVR